MIETEPPVVLTRTLRATATEVFDAWTRPELLSLWLAPGANVVEHAEADVRIGGRFLLRTRAPDGSRHQISGHYLAIEPHRHILKSWIYEGPLDLLAGEETQLQIDLVPRNEMTDLRLTHRRLTRANVRDAYAGDWPSCLDKLDGVLRKSPS